MKEEILEKIKKEYEKKRLEQTENKKIQKRLEQLEKNKWVKEYIELREQSNNYNFEKSIVSNEINIIDSSFRNYLYQIKETNEIYVYLGTYTRSYECDIVHGASDIRVKRDDPQAEYCLYKNLENDQYQQVPIETYSEFEKKHKIIFPNTYLTDAAYYELQREFFKTAIKQGQEVACKKVLSRSKKKI